MLISCPPPTNRSHVSYVAGHGPPAYLRPPRTVQHASSFLATCRNSRLRLCASVYFPAGYVLTAASCVWDVNSGEAVEPSNITVWVGGETLPVAFLNISDCELDSDTVSHLCGRQLVRGKLLRSPAPPPDGCAAHAPAALPLPPTPLPLPPRPCSLDVV